MEQELTPDVLVDAIKKFLANPPALDKDKLGEYQKFEIHWAEKFKDLMAKYFIKDERDNTGKNRPSSLGKCTRQIAYTYHGIEGLPISPETKMTFLTGELLELIFYMLADAVGHPVQNTQAKADLGWVSGSIDGEIGDTLIDVKSMSDAAHAIATREGISDAFGYQTQLELYKVGRQKEKGAWIGINKNKGKISVFPSVSRPHLVQIAKEKAELVQASTPDNLPARDFQLEYEKKTSRLKLPFQCKFCDHRERCWEITSEEPGYNNSVTIYAKGPRNV